MQIKTTKEPKHLRIGLFVIMRWTRISIDKEHKMIIILNNKEISLQEIPNQMRTKAWALDPVLTLPLSSRLSVGSTKREDLVDNWWLILSSTMTMTTIEKTLSTLSNRITEEIWTISQFSLKILTTLSLLQVELGRFVERPLEKKSRLALSSLTIS